MSSSSSAKPILFLLAFLKVTGGMSIGNTLSCGEKRNCILLKECVPFMNYINTLEKPLKPATVEFLRSQQCGFQEGYPKVCCSTYSNIPSSSTQPSRIDDSRCRVKNECILLKNCRPFMDLIKSLGKPLAASVVSFLRAQQCGFQEGFPKVCCTLLPKNMRLLKHARPEKRPNVNKAPDRWSLFEDDHTLKTSTELDLSNIIDTVTTIKPSRSTMSSAKLKEKADAFNKAFGMSEFLDFDGPFDLFRRKRHNNDSEVDIEIR